MNGFSCDLISLRIKQRLKYLLSQKVLDEHMNMNILTHVAFLVLSMKCVYSANGVLDFSYPEKLEACGAYPGSVKHNQKKCSYKNGETKEQFKIEVPFVVFTLITALGFFGIIN